MLYGLLNLSFTGYLITILVLTQITIASVTIYLHRAQTHQALTLHPIASHFFRFWLWMTTGIQTKAWIAVHRKHHAKCETVEDPHSPRILGLKEILLKGAELYRAAKTKENLDHYGHGTPDDWLERKIYAGHDRIGTILMLIINLILFGIPGLTIWAIQMMWIPFFAGGIVNGIGHYYGYRNFEPKDTSTNFLPLAIIIGGEELHNNHHTFPSSAKFSVKWWEFDIGWFYICTLQFFKLASVKRSIPKLTQNGKKTQIDLDAVKVIISHRLQIMADYKNQVIIPVLTTERKKMNNHQYNISLDAEKLLIRSELLLDEKTRQRALLLLTNNHVIDQVYQFKMTLQKIWEKTTATQQEIIDAIKQWCRDAEINGDALLKNFAKRLPHYST